MVVTPEKLEVVMLGTTFMPVVLIIIVSFGLLVRHLLR